MLDQWCNSNIRSHIQAMENGTDPTCNFWDPALDSEYPVVCLCVCCVCVHACMCACCVYVYVHAVCACGGVTLKLTSSISILQMDLVTGQQRGAKWSLRLMKLLCAAVTTSQILLFFW